MIQTTDPQDELFIVVDENDTVVGYKTRQECHKDKSLIHRSVDILVFNEKGELLLQKRSNTKDTYAGYYTISASGHVGKGQSYEEAAYRELKEEIGITASLAHAKTFLSHLPNETEMVSVFKTTHDGPFKLHPDEVDSVKFIPINELRSMEEKLTPGTKDSLRQLHLL